MVIFRNLLHHAMGEVFFCETLLYWCAVKRRALARRRTREEAPMGRGSGKKSGKKQRLLEEIAEFEVKKRNGLMRLVGAIIVFVVITAVKETLVAQGVAIASDMMVNALFYITALVLAGVAGFGSRDYVRANGQLRAAREKLGK